MIGSARRSLRRLLRHRPTGIAIPSDAAHPTEADTSAPEPMFPEERWFDDHIGAAREVIEFLGGDGLTIKGQRVADVGCGDGIIDLGLAAEGQPAEVVGYDVNQTDSAHLLSLAKQAEYAEDLPDSLTFIESYPDRIPTDDASFDVVVSWSAFEHVSDPLAMVREIRRIVRPHGAFFLQLWPFYYSEHGSHLFDWYAGGFPHLVLDTEDIRRKLLDEDVKPHSDYIWGEYGTLNKITLDELGSALHDGGFNVAKVELISAPTHLPPEVAHLPLSDLLVSGVKVLASPRHD